jgi:hypothetical protein
MRSGALAGPPAHHAMNRRDRALFQDLGEEGLVLLVELGRHARRSNVGWIVILGSLGKPTKLAARVVRPHLNRSAPGKRPSVCHLESFLRLICEYRKVRHSAN